MQYDVDNLAALENLYFAYGIQGKVDDAISVAQKMKPHVGALDSFKRQIRIMLEDNRYHEILRLIDEHESIHSEDKDSIELALIKSECLYFTSRKEEAIQLLEEKNKQTPNVAKILLVLGAFYQKDRRFKNALNCYEEAEKVANDSELFQAKHELGLFYFNRDNGIKLLRNSSKKRKMLSIRLTSHAI